MSVNTAREKENLSLSHDKTKKNPLFHNRLKIHHLSYFRKIIFHSHVNFFLRPFIQFEFKQKIFFFISMGCHIGQY